MSKRKLGEASEVHTSSNKAAKSEFVRQDVALSADLLPVQNGVDVEVSSVVEKSEDELEEKTELEIRDFLLEESSLGLDTRRNEKVYEVIKVEGVLPNLSLPPGWIALFHHSGGIIYLHRPTRVCTWARPYHIGDASVRKHDVPVAAIPCLHQLNGLKELGMRNQDSDLSHQVTDHNSNQNDNPSQESDVHVNKNHSDDNRSGRKITNQRSKTDNQDSNPSPQVNNYNSNQNCYESKVNDDDVNQNHSQRSEPDNQHSTYDDQESSSNNQDSNPDNKNINNLDNQKNYHSNTNTSNLDNQSSDHGNKNGSLNNHKIHHSNTDISNFDNKKDHHSNQNTSNLDNQYSNHNNRDISNLDNQYSNHDHQNNADSKQDRNPDNQITTNTNNQTDDQLNNTIVDQDGCLDSQSNSGLDNQSHSNLAKQESGHLGLYHDDTSQNITRESNQVRSHENQTSLTGDLPIVSNESNQVRNLETLTSVTGGPQGGSNQEQNKMPEEPTNVSGVGGSNQNDSLSVVNLDCTMDHHITEDDGRSKVGGRINDVDDNADLRESGVNLDCTMDHHTTEDDGRSKETKNGDDLKRSDNVVSQNPNELFRLSSGPVEMTTLSEISEYLGKLWEFQGITGAVEKVALMGVNPQKSNNNNNESSKESIEILETIPYLMEGSNPKVKKRKEFVVNPVGKSPQSLLNEYCIKILKLKPVYDTKESGDPKRPFLATVEVDGLQYGCGVGASKKQARHIAARATLDIFIPGTYEKLSNIEQYLKVFDNVPIEDPSIYNLTTKLGLMTPHQVLQECLTRNQGMLTSELKFSMHHTAEKNVCYSIECGKYKATGPCRNKKVGRELASQALLQQMHPHLENWGSILRIYIDKHTMHKFIKPEDVCQPSSVASSINTELNMEMLSDLKHEMWKLLKKRESNSSNTCTKFTDIKI